MIILDKEQLQSILREEVATVTFTKTDGSERVMKCTLDPSYIPPVIVDESKPKKERKENPDLILVWDTENSGWRSFKLSSIKTIDI